MKINWILILMISASIFQKSYAGEGMWLPLFLKSLNEAEMQSMGMKISAEDIYSVNKGSLKDAIVHFGGFCTSEIISDQGLLLTNHHCGYGQIQSHSSVDNNLLEDGFWAKTKAEELSNPGLTATFINEIIDVTDDVLRKVNDKMSDTERQSIIDSNLEIVRAEIKKSAYQDAYIRPFYNGNQYFAFITTTYRDVRLVGTPPESIGKFGADTDNWEWPRHTGDFSLFRIYAGLDNLPADYSTDNKPYNPKHHLPISLDGVEEGDFTLVFGFPGRTNQYLPAVAVEQTVDVLNPAKIGIREKSLAVMSKYMRADESIKIQYASKFASIANYWKKWIGESQGLVQTKAIQKKKDQEESFISYSAGPVKKTNTNNKAIIDEFGKLYKGIEPYALTRDYYSEITSRNVEALRVSGYMRNLVTRFEKNGAEGYTSYANRLKGFLEGIYKNYNSDVDQEIFTELVSLYKDKLSDPFVPDMISGKNMLTRAMGTAELSKQLYANSFLPHGDKVLALLDADPASAVAQIKVDPIYSFSSEWKKVYDKEVAAPYNIYKSQIDSLQRLYMKAQLANAGERKLFPDANSTMRVSYGQVNGYVPIDGVFYTPVTHLDGVIAKYKPGDYEFDVPAKLIDLYNKKDYGQYAAENGKIPVCFLGSNHTTGGNSGSPAIDAHGNLIGLNFDRVWEGTMSDLNYDKSICRNIMVDARYVLFIVDKFAGATHLIDEMTLVHPKKKLKK
jgi:hypothetical protein